jgi:NADH:ubiquinone oxidoreductase subunit D
MAQSHSYESQTFLKYYSLNFGPQHPLVFDALCLVLGLYGEVITKANSHVTDLLHYSIEKLVEFKTVTQDLLYFKHLGYVLMTLQVYFIFKTLYCVNYNG